jgi:hypothetical protein
MGAPQKLTNPDFGVRGQTAYDLEVQLVKFLTQLFGFQRLDNPAVNALQPNAVPFDPVERAQSLTGKVPPQITRGRVPRTVTGEIDVTQLPNVPSIIVQATSGHVETKSTFVEAKICASAYDENPNSQGYQDVLNMIETMALALTSYGQKGIDESYVIVLPMDWKLHEEDTAPYFAGEIISKWELPSARPLPDLETFGIIPAEHIELRATSMPPDLFGGEPEPIMPPEPPQPEDDIFVGTFRPADVNASADLIRFDGMANGWQIRFAVSNPNNDLPEPILDGQFYYVVNATATTFQIASSLGGAVTALNDSGTGNNNEIWRKI